MNPGELIAQRRQTRAYIRSDTTSIVLSRSSRTKTGTGGFRDTKDDLPPQNFKLLWASLGQQFVTPVTGGQAKVLQDQLMAVWDADIKVGDTFTYDDEQYEVAEISKTEYRIIATLTSRSARG